MLPAERWKPYRSIAMWYLWRSLELLTAVTDCDENQFAATL